MPRHYESTVVFDSAWMAFRDLRKQRVKCFGVLWEPKDTLARQFRKVGATMVDTTEPGTVLVISTSLLHWHDFGPASDEWEIRDTPVTHELHAWIQNGMIPVAGPDMQFLLNASAAKIEQRARLRAKTVHDVIAELEEVAKAFDDVIGMKG